VSQTAPVRAYAALGDSIVRGEGSWPSWTDLLATGLSRADPGLRYRNLGIAGARAGEVAAEPLDEAIALQPDLVTVMCGANDVLLSTQPDVERFREAYARILGRLRAETGAAIVTATYPDGARFLPLRPRTLARVERGLAEVSTAIVEETRRHGALCVEGHRHPADAVQGHFEPDGFHPSAEGHRKMYRVVAAHLHEGLGIDARGAADADEAA